MAVMKAGKDTLAKSAAAGDRAFVSRSGTEVIHFEPMPPDDDLVARGMPRGWLFTHHMDDALGDLALPAAIDIHEVLDAGCTDSPEREMHGQPENTECDHNRGPVKSPRKAALGAMAKNESRDARDQDNDTNDKTGHSILSNAVRCPQ
jgi:hypothetical protein